MSITIKLPSAMSATLDPVRIKDAYESLLKNPDAKQQLAEAAAPLASICTSQYINRSGWAAKHRDDLIGHAAKTIVETVDAIAKSSKPVACVQSFINVAVERAVITHGIELSRSLGLGQSTSKILKTNAEAKREATKRDETIRQIIRTMGHLRPCWYCEPPHDTDNWYPVVRRVSGVEKIVAYACKPRWEEGVAFISPMPRLRRLRTIVRPLMPHDQRKSASEFSLEVVRDEMLSMCNSDVQREMVALKLAGFESDEIAKRLNCSVRSVQLKIKEVADRYIPWHQSLSA